MSTPFVFVGTYRLKEGKREAYLRHLADFVPYVEENEPQLVLFSTYLDEEGEHISGVQVHPDADSMLTHMQVVREHVAESYADYLDETVSMQIFGEPTDDVLAMMSKLAGDGVPVSINRPVEGFDRLQRGAPAAP